MEGIEEVGELGQRLHEVESAIAAGNLAVRGIVSDKPVDVDTLRAEQAELNGLRMNRGALRAQLESAKINSLPKYRWM